jgi:lysozyme
MSNGTDIPALARKIDPELARRKIAILLRGMERHTGKRPIIYTDIPFHADVMEGHFADYAYWLRSVAAEPHERYENRDWTFWQYTTTGRVPGIKGAVDRNAFTGTRAQWQAYLKRQGVVR